MVYVYVFHFTKLLSFISLSNSLEKGEQIKKSNIEWNERKVQRNDTFFCLNLRHIGFHLRKCGKNDEKTECLYFFHFYFIFNSNAFLVDFTNWTTLL